MSGYLEVKYPFKSSLGLSPFKSWKRQWCILRPSWTRAGGGCLAVYCSEAGSAAGALELPPGSCVRRAKSRSKPHAFAVFAPDDPRKPRVLLAASSSHDAQLWMDKIKNLLNNNSNIPTESTLRDTYSVTVAATELSSRCGVSQTDATLRVEPAGAAIAAMLVPWACVRDVERVDNSCLLHVDSSFPQGAGTLELRTSLAPAATRALSRALRASRARRLSRSDGDLRHGEGEDLGQRGSWCSRPSEVSLDDTDLLLSKECRVIPSGQLARCAAAGDLAPTATATAIATSATSFDDSMSDRRSLVSVASGVYEEIADAPLVPHRSVVPDVEPTYESVAECVYATMRRGKRCPPPPLPPRAPFGTIKLGESWNSRLNKTVVDGVTRHSSLGSLPRCCSVSSATSTHSEGYKTKTLPKQDRKNAFNVFRKRLKSDSRPSEPKSPETKENRDETKKKKFDFTPTKELFKNFRKIKGLKMKSRSNLSKIGETKSCEFLDETEHSNACSSRCSKSVECLEGSPSEDYLDDSDAADLSLELDDATAASLSLPQDIVALILRGRERIDSMTMRKQIAEDDYMPMSPIVAPPTPIEQHYIVMSPRTNIA